MFCYARFDLRKLIQLAERIRGRPCTYDNSQIPKRGASNFVVLIEFDDGVEWVFRAPCFDLISSQSSINRLLASEAATLKYIKEHSSIPVPEVYHYRYVYQEHPRQTLELTRWQLHLRQ